MRRPRMGASTFAAAAFPGRPRTRLAFTMAEVLFAIIILGLGLILLAASFPVGIAQSQKAEESTAAGLIAQHALDQITKVVATYARPEYAAGGWNPAFFTAPPAAAPVTPVVNYVNRPLTMGLLDGAMASDNVTDDNPVDRRPDLRVKLLYPNWPTADGRPQDPIATYSALVPPYPRLGVATGNDSAGVPATFLNVWGFRLEWDSNTPPNAIWHENVKWAYPADRRYYWYAFYRQMYEDPAGYPHPLGTPNPWLGLAQLDAVRSDHITRRTYRVWIVAAKIPAGLPSLLEPRQVQTPEMYADQWLAVAPIRVPAADGTTGVLAVTGAGNDWLQDAGAGTDIATGIQQGRIKRGGFVVDAWGEVYRIADVSTNAVRLDRAPRVPAGGIDDLLPFWFNPNAVAVFPTIVVKQADLP